MSSDEEGRQGRQRVWTSRSEGETIGMGRRIGSVLQAGDVVALTGPLGSGKTCFTKGIALGLGVSTADAVISPTFVYLRVHRGRLPLYHLDAYRLTGEEEFLALGGWEMLGEDGVSVIEWADRVAPALPGDRLSIGLEPRGPSTREIRVTGLGGTAPRVEEIR